MLKHFQGQAKNFSGPNVTVGADCLRVEWSRGNGSLGLTRDGKTVTLMLGSVARVQLPVAVVSGFSFREVPARENVYP